MAGNVSIYHFCFKQGKLLASCKRELCFERKKIKSSLDLNPVSPISGKENSRRQFLSCNHKVLTSFATHFTSPFFSFIFFLNGKKFQAITFPLTEEENFFFFSFFPKVVAFHIYGHKL